MKTTKSDIERVLWKACDSFRGKIDSSRYKDYILSMLFVKYLSDVCKETKEKYMKQYDGDEQRVERAMSREPFVLDDESTFELDGEEIAFENIKECLHRMELIYPNKINSKLLFEAYDNIQKLVNMDMINSLTIKTPDDVLNVDIFQIQDKFYTNLRNAKTSWQKFVERVTSDEIRDIVMGWTGYDIQEMTAVQDVTTGLEVDYSKKLYMLTQEINDVNGMIEKLQNNMTSDAIEPLFIPEMEQLHEELINKKEELIEKSNRIKSKMISESKKKTGKIDSILNRPLEEPNYDYENKKNKRIIKLKNIQKLGREIEIEDFNCTGVIININIPDNSVTILRKDGKTVDYDITDDIFKTID